MEKARVQEEVEELRKLRLNLAKTTPVYFISYPSKVNGQLQKKNIKPIVT